MSQALRSTTPVRRPVDMFFLPSDTEPSGVEGSDAGAESTSEHDPYGSSATAGSKKDAVVSSTDSKNDPVSRETSTKAGAAQDSTAEKETQPRVQSAQKAPGDTSMQGADTQGTGTTADNSDSPSDDARETAGEGDVSRETSASETSQVDESQLHAVPGAQFAEIAVADIHPNRKQPRQVFDEDELAELAFSVKELGVLQPVVVRPSRENEGASYELVMGERRWRAVGRAGMETIPAIIRETSDDDLLRDALLENLHRSQLNPLEEAAAYQQLLDEFGATQEELSQRIGRSRPQISNTLRLLRLPPLVQRRVAAGVLSSGHARALLGLTDPAEMERLAQRIVSEGLSVRATEEAVALTDGLKRHGSKRKPTTRRHDDRLNYIADAFSDRLDTSVKIQLGARKGKMTIEFASVEDLNRIIDVLDPKMDSRE